MYRKQWTTLKKITVKLYLSTGWVAKKYCLQQNNLLFE